MGIAPEPMPRIFDLFAQGDRTMARSEGGLGIGLTLVRKLCKMHGGAVTAANEGHGKGSEFTVRLPALEEPAARKPGPPGALPRVARQSSRVLVVDDNLDNARGLSRLLKLLGHDVRVTHDGKEAIEAARAHRPEIVLLGIGLPGMDGYEVARRLRQDECCRGSLIIAVSGYSQPEDLRRSEAAGFDHHLTKPVDYDDLMTLFAPRPGLGPSRARRPRTAPALRFCRREVGPKPCGDCRRGEAETSLASQQHRSGTAGSCWRSYARTGLALCARHPMMKAPRPAAHCSGLPGSEPQASRRPVFRRTMIVRTTSSPTIPRSPSHGRRRPPPWGRGVRPPAGSGFQRTSSLR